MACSFALTQQKREYKEDNMAAFRCAKAVMELRRVWGEGEGRD